MLSVDNYNIKSWTEKYPDYNVKLEDLEIHPSWKEFTTKNIFIDNLKKIDEYLSYCLKKTNGKVNIYPYPDLVFNALNTTPLEEIKVVILGQDPYIRAEYHDEKLIPQAMGLAFSVPNGIKIPPSLQNIYNNLLRFGHIHKKPLHGNLIFWAQQGCFLLNTTLTVQEGCSNSHESKWTSTTDAMIKFISDKTTNVVFVLWGGPALKKKPLIDQTKHKIIISSHPSPLSCKNTLQQYKSFETTDQFGEINKYLKEYGKGTINFC
jgi:uracil-DNA glycosylase